MAVADKNIEIGLEVEDASLVAGMDKAAAKASEAGAKIQQGLERAAGGAKSLARELDRATTAGKNLQAAQKGFNWSGVASVASSAAGFGMMAVGSRLAASKDEGRQLAGGALHGAGPGVGMGAAIGSMIAPGVGTAIGAAAGALAGAASGMLNAGAVSNDLTRIGGGVEGLSGSTFGGLLREANVIARQSLDQLKRINNVGGGGTAVAVWGA